MTNTRDVWVRRAKDIGIPILKWVVVLGILWAIAWKITPEGGEIFDTLGDVIIPYAFVIFVIHWMGKAKEKEFKKEYDKQFPERKRIRKVKKDV